MKKVITNSFKETQKAGFSFAKTLIGGVVVALHGDLGSGKTTFTQGFAKGLGITAKVISPTFIIMRTYKIRSKNQKSGVKVFYHVDLYRIEHEKDVEGLGLLEIMENEESIVVVEWPEKIGNLLPAKHKDIFFTYLDDRRRDIVFES